MVDVLHGVEVVDPYRWLEDGDAPETRVWVEQQNQRTAEALDTLPDRKVWHERLVALFGLPVSSGLAAAGGSVFTLDRADGQSQFVLTARQGSTPPNVLVDPSSLALDETAAIDWFAPSRDGRLVAYGVSIGGDENSVLRVIDVATGAILADEIDSTRACSVSWRPDGSGFHYTRYPPDDQYNRAVYSHRLATSSSDDPLVWSDPTTPEAWPSVEMSDDGRHVLVSVSHGWSRTDLHLFDGTNWTTIVSIDGAVTRLEFDGERLLGVTTLGAPKGRVVGVDLDDPTSGSWRTLVAEGDDVIEGVECVGDELVVVSLRSGCAILTRHQADGTVIGEIEFDEPVSVTGLDAERDRLYVQTASFTRPSAMSTWTADEGLRTEPITWRDRYDPTSLVAWRTTYRSLDGTEIGLFLVHRADASPSASTPCILTGYGGFNIAETPTFSVGIAAWCERGGLYAIAGLRGGSEGGEAWHEAGMRAVKQNVFDDFAAAADHLVNTSMTARHRLAVRGGSNGGLLMGATMTQRPDLASAVVCQVPLLDMIRFHRFLIARLWMPEYGDPDVAEEFAWLFAYSPYHRVVDGECYPSTLITTAESDTRVDPMHARKMTALLQWASRCETVNPILLRLEERAGHGVGKPVHKQADELADVLSFVSWRLGDRQ